MSLDLSSAMGEGATSTMGRAERRRTTTTTLVERAVASEARAIAPIRFADAETKERVCRDASASRSIVLRPRADAPGSLAHGIDGDLESALALRGALPSGLGEGASLEDRLKDQLSRATCVPVRGVCLALPPLGACVDADGVLSDVDARYLGAWLRAVEARPLPISILFDEQDRSLKARVPRTLGDVVLDLEPEPATTRYDAMSDDDEPESYASPTDDIASPIEHVATSTCVEIETSTDDEETSYASSDDEGLSIPDLLGMSGGEASHVEREASAEAAVDEDWEQEPSFEGALVVADPVVFESPAAPPVEAAADERDEVEEPTTRAMPEAPAKRERSMEVVAAESDARPLKSLKKAMSETLRPEPPQEIVHVAAEPSAEVRAERVLATAEWRHHAVELDAARGPKPVSSIERLFAQRYLPLLGALMRHEVDHAVSSVIEQWSESFAQSYTDAYSALKVTGKRPTMVLDAFDVASRIARLSSARSVKLVLVDSMSFDLGERVATRMKAALDKRAVLVERTTLWSALPTTTPTQMSLLARGPDGLRETAPVSSSDPDITRGRNISTLRRERVGSRELMKLDLVEARLRGPGVGYDERLDAIADEVSEILVKLMETLPPRTLLYVFGDHGFVLGTGANGWASGGATQGGASPEEVLVSGHAWLADAMQ